MIYGRICDVERYAPMGTSLKRCIDFAQENDLLSFEKGRHNIDGDALYVNIAEYTTTTPENRFWEAHRDYIDLHILLRGEERIDLGWTADMEQKEYVPADDFLPLCGEPNSHVELRPGDFLLCYPEDGHRTGVQVTKPTALKKAIFKIRL